MKRTTKAQPKTNKKTTSNKKSNTVKKQSSREKILMDAGLLPKRITKKQLDDIIQTTNNTKMGRPSKYKPAMCIQLLEIMAEGKSKETACIELGISHYCMHDWCNKGTTKEPNSNYHQDFHTAIIVGENMSKRWWEEVGRLNVHNKNFNATLYMMNMQNRHGWTRKWEGKLDEEKTVNVTHTHEILTKERPDEHKAEVLRILNESGALKSNAEGIADTKVH